MVCRRSSMPRSFHLAPLGLYTCSLSAVVGSAALSAWPFCPGLHAFVEGGVIGHSISYRLYSKSLTKGPRTVRRGVLFTPYYDERTIAQSPCRPSRSNTPMRLPLRPGCWHTFQLNDLLIPYLVLIWYDSNKFTVHAAGDIPMHLL